LRNDVRNVVGILLWNEAADTKRSRDGGGGGALRDHLGPRAQARPAPTTSARSGSLDGLARVLIRQVRCTGVARAWAILKAIWRSSKQNGEDY
jgi:hypothetical protein